MRIISGKYKSLKLIYPKSKSVRPTMDRVKESMFSMIGDALVNANVLSLFSGSGSLGFEALSRGAKRVIFVDSFKDSIQAIKENIDNLHIPQELVSIYPIDALRVIEQLSKQKMIFDYIFIDPPYYKDYIKKTLMKLECFDILAPTSYLVAEHSKEEPVVTNNFLEVIKSKRFGATYVTICKKVSN